MSRCEVCGLVIRTADEHRRDAIHKQYDPYHEPRWRKQ